ncbi:uncharacterized protein EV422DRAFT_503723 [Fimicolochytrium jonesii]|uniref:uncharacterized protein n=1 Tax=Fimicolochytrium jonesii TaxID=1396493 RepID=UPI0022FDDC18|nr:uncharacterized protein EV422DRAFT_503723 [Fimicolochytrium jonesii]KAI8824939.1 hypothetical protein EV422DRAFT_503723 [Fimicolochytrium jonesii]
MKATKLLAACAGFRLCALPVSPRFAIDINSYMRNNDPGVIGLPMNMLMVSIYKIDSRLKLDAPYRVALWNKLKKNDPVGAQKKNHPVDESSRCAGGGCAHRKRAVRLGFLIEPSPSSPPLE